MNYKQEEQLRKMFRWCIEKNYQMNINEHLPTARIIEILLIAIKDINNDINYAETEEHIHFPWEEE